MQEKFPVLILIAAGLLDLSGASRNEHHVSEVLGQSFPGEDQSRTESSPVPSEVSSITEDDSDEAIFNFQNPAVDPTNEATADFIPVYTETAAGRTAMLPKDLVRNLEVPEQLHTEAAALKFQDGRTFPSKLLSSISIPVSTQRSQATMHLEQPDRSLQGKPENITEVGFSPTSSGTGLPQPLLSGGTHEDFHKFTAVFSIPVSKQKEAPSPKTSLLTSMVNFHPPGKEIAASPFPTGVKIALPRARVDWLPTGTPPTSKRPKDTNPQVQPDSKAGVTLAYLKKTQSMDAKVTTSAFLQRPALGDLDAVYSRMTWASTIQFSPVLSLKQETTGSKARNSTAVINGSGHPTQLPDLQTLPQGNVHSSSLLMHLAAPVHDDALPSPFEGPISTTDRQQTLSLSQTLKCTKQHVSQETNRSSQEITALVLQRDTDRQAMTSKPEKSRSPESPQTSANSSPLSQSWISTLKLSQTTKELKGETSAVFPGTSTFENAVLQPVSTFDSVHAGLQPPGTSFPTYVGLQLMGIPTSAEKGLHIPTSSTSTGPKSQVQGISAHPASREAFPMMLQMSTVEDSERKKSFPQQIGKTGSPPLTPQASPVPSPSGLHNNGNQKVPLHSFAPSASQIQQAGSLAAFVSTLPSLHAQGRQSSSTTAHPEPVAPSVSDESPAQALVQQFGLSQGAATKNLSAFRGDQLIMLPSSSYLSFLLKSTNGMICLQPMRDSSLPTKFPNTSVGGLISIQQILATSNSSVLDLASLQNLSPSSLILVKPVFILLPTDRPDLQMVPSPEGEADRRTALVFTNKQDLNLGTPKSSHDIAMKTSSSYPTSKSLRSETTLSTASNQQVEKTNVTSQPVLTNPNYTATTSLFQAVTSASHRLLDPRLRISTAVQAMQLHRLPEEMQVPTPSSQEAKGTDLLLLHSMLGEPFTSTVPPSVVSAQHSPRISPKVFFTAEKPHSSSLIPLWSAKGLPVFQMPSQPPFTITGTIDQVQHSKKLLLQTTSSRQGLVTIPSSVHTKCTECLTLHLARTIKYPLKMSTSITPLQSTLQSLLSTESLQRLPSQVRFVPSTSPAFSELPAGNDRKDSAAGSSTACSRGVTVRAKAAQTHTASIKPDLIKRFEFTPIVSKPFLMTDAPTIAPAHIPFSTKVQMETASGKLLATITHPRTYTNSPASPPSPVSTHVPLLSTMKHDQIHRAPTKLSSQANMGENTKPTENSTSARKIGTGQFLGASVYLSAMFNTGTQQPATAVLANKVVLTPVQATGSAGSIIALERQPKLTQTTSQSPLVMTSLSAAKNDDIAASLPNKTVFLPPTSTIRSNPNIVLPTVARVNKSPVVSTSMGKSEDTLVKGDAATASQSLAHQASARRPLEKVSLEDNIEHETGHSSPDSVMDATGPSTTKAFSVSANGLVHKFTNQSAVFDKVAGNDAEVLVGRELIQFLPTPESPLYSSQSLVVLTPQGNSLLGVANTEQSERLFLNTEAEEMVGTKKVTEEAAEGVVTLLTLLDSEPSTLLRESHQRRILQSDAAILNGLAVVSDDVCGSGNYTVQMSLYPAAEAGPEVEGSAPSQETFLALIAVQSNGGQPVLQIRSCCVTPSASPGGPGAMCCLFHRLPFECRHIQLLQTSKSRAASFTIQLFQMLNHSVAYLHCEINVCLHGKTGCEQGCFESGEPLLQPSDRNSYGNLHNLISFGPVLRKKNRFLYKPVEGPDSAVLVPVLLGSLTGFAILGSAFVGLWLHHRQKTKTICCPQLGEIRGL